MADDRTLPQDSQPAAPFPAQSAENDRPRNRGWFALGNTVSATHALYSDRDLAGLQAEVAAFLAQSVSDDGGDSEVGARRRALHEYRARVHRRIVQLDAAIEAKGLFDRRARLRVAWLQQLQGLIATARAIDSLLGTGRRQKAIPSHVELLTGGPR